MTDSLAPSVAGAPAPATVPPFDQVAVAIAPGDDLVVRMPGILLVVAVDATAAPAPASPKLGGWGAAPAAAPAAVPVGDMRVGELISLGRRVSGAGSRAPGKRLHDEGVHVVGIPKTMDNDVHGTDYCIGFSTCVTRTIELTHRLRTSAGSHERFLVIEVFGR